MSIRFPRVTRIRDDKDWSTATDLSRLKVHVHVYVSQCFNHCSVVFDTVIIKNIFIMSLDSSWSFKTVTKTVLVAKSQNYY